MLCFSYNEIIRVFFVVVVVGMSGMDRHKGPWHFATGASHRKAFKECTEWEAQELTKTHGMIEFSTHPSPSSRQCFTFGTLRACTCCIDINLIFIWHVYNRKWPECHEDKCFQNLIWIHRLMTSAYGLSIWRKNSLTNGLQKTLRIYTTVKSLGAKSATQKVANNVSQKCTPARFEWQNWNRKVVKCSRLCFSPANGWVYCFFCKLMGVVRS